MKNIYKKESWAIRLIHLLIVVVVLLFYWVDIFEKNKIYGFFEYFLYGITIAIDFVAKGKYIKLYFFYLLAYLLYVVLNYFL